VVDTSLSGARVARKLDRLMIERGKPKIVVSDNGSEFTSNAILTLADQTGVEWYITPHKPIPNAFIERFNGRLRHGGRLSSLPSPSVSAGSDGALYARAPRQLPSPPPPKWAPNSPGELSAG
jgi:transposase InsO family protein